MMTAATDRPDRRRSAHPDAVVAIPGGSYSYCNIRSGTMIIDVDGDVGVIL